MVPLDDDTLDLADRIAATATRSDGRAIRHRPTSIGRMPPQACNPASREANWLLNGGLPRPNWQRDRG